MVMKIQDASILGRDVVEHQHFGGPDCLHLQGEDGGGKVLQNVGILQHHNSEDDLN